MRFSKDTSGNVLRGTLILSVGSVVAKVIGVISIPVLARLYSPSDYGVMAVYMSLITIISPFMTLRYAVAIPLPKSQTLAINVIALCGLITVFSGAVITVLLFTLGPWALKLLSMEVLEPWLLLIIVGSVFTSSFEVAQMWGTRKLSYRILANAQILKSVSAEFTKVALAMFGYQSFGLLVGHMIGQLGGCALAVLRFRHDIFEAKKKITLRRIGVVARVYIGFPTYRLLAHMLMIISGQSLIIFSAYQFDSEVTGQLGMALVVIAFPLTLIGMSVGNALYGEVSKLGRHKPVEIKRIAIDTAKNLTILSLLPAIILMIYAPEIFVLVLGEQWEQSGMFSSIFSVFLVFQFVIWPIIKILNVFNEQWLFLEINLIRVLMLTFCYVLTSVFEFSATTMVWMYSAIMSLHYFYTIFRVFAFINMKIAIEKTSL